MENNCGFCKQKTYHIFTSKDSKCKADIYFDHFTDKNLMMFFGNWQKYYPVEISYCPFCGRKLRKRPKTQQNANEKEGGNNG